MIFRILVIIVLALLQVSSVFAHGDEPRLEVSVDRINPGGVIDVRGVDFEPEEAVVVMLVNSQSSLPMGEVVADVEGVFLITLVLPVELAEGTYNFLAITDDHNITSPDITIQGPAVLVEGQGEEERRDEEEPLLMPIPTFPPGVVPGLAPGATQAVDADPEDSGINFPAVVISTIVLIVGVVLMVNRMGKRS